MLLQSMQKNRCCHTSFPVAFHQQVPVRIEFDVTILGDYRRMKIFSMSWSGSHHGPKCHIYWRKEYWCFGELDSWHRREGWCYRLRREYWSYHPQQLTQASDIETSEIFVSSHLIALSPYLSLYFPYPKSPSIELNDPRASFAVRPLAFGLFAGEMNSIDMA